MNADTIKDTDNFTNSKRDIKADNYNKTIIFNMDNDDNSSLSRVNSQNYPDTTNNLDSIAEKLRLNKQKNKSTPTKSKLNKLEKCSEEKLNEKGLSKSFHVPSEKLKPEIIMNTNDDSQKVSKKNKFMANFLRRLSISTPKIFSKNKKHTKSKHNSDIKAATIDRTTINMSNNFDSILPIITDNSNKLVNGVDEKHSTELTPHSKNIRKILQRLTRKKEKGKVASEPPSSIESRPSLSSVVNNGLNFETTTSCNNIYLNKLCKDELQNYNCSSADCILDIQKRGGNSTNHRESVSSNSDDMKEHEAKLNAVVNTIPHDTVSDEFHNLETSSIHVDGDKLSPLSIKTSEFKFDTQRSCHSTLSNGYQAETSHNVKLTLALYGYCNYGLSSSRLASKSCIEFRSANRNRKTKSIENVTAKELVHLSKSSEYHENTRALETESELKEEVVDVDSEISNVIDTVTIRQKEETNDPREQSSVVLRKSQRPNDIKLRKSREPSQNMVARSSMIMLVVSHNSPRAKIVSTQLTTPNKEIDLNSSINGSLSTNMPAMRLNFDNSSNNEHKISENCVPFTALDEVRKSMALSTTIDGNKLDNKISENGIKELHETMDGNYFLELVHKYEMEILIKIDIVQKYIDDPQLEFDDEVSGQLMVTVGKAKLLLSEKMLQFKGLCEKNISGIIEENELPTLSSDLNGFWDMVFGQIEDINRNFVVVEKIRNNGWKMIPYEVEGKSRSNTPAKARKFAGTKSANTNHSTPMKKKVQTSADIAAQNKAIAEKRKNMMLFKLNQKASMAPKPDPSFSEDITFY